MCIICFICNNSLPYLLFFSWEIKLSNSKHLNTFAVHMYCINFSCYSMHVSLSSNHSEVTRTRKETRSLGQGPERFRRGTLVCENSKKILCCIHKKLFKENNVSFEYNSRKIGT